MVCLTTNSIRKRKEFVIGFMMADFVYCDNGVTNNSFNFSRLKQRYGYIILTMQLILSQVYIPFYIKTSMTTN